jgi:hypothetical protein
MRSSKAGAVAVIHDRRSRSSATSKRFIAMHSAYRITILALVSALNAATALSAAPHKHIPLYHEVIAETETYRYPNLEFAMVIKKDGHTTQLYLICLRPLEAAKFHYDDFKIKVLDDRREEMPCSLIAGEPDPFLISNQCAIGELEIDIKPGRNPATASVWYQGYEHVFTFKLKANEAIK